ncbi:MAG: DUF177 domain-containing protein [Bacteroidetes bacterium]|nr:DUF177 domain-containing protein [Bacteroidota bacterium]
MPKLRPGANSFRFHMGSVFFRQVEHSLIQRADVAVEASIDRQPALLDARIALEGNIELVCDRCLQPYPKAIVARHRIVYSYDAPDEQPEAATDDELVFISRNLQTLDMSQDLYDLVSLQVPLRKAPCDEDNTLCLADEQVRNLLDAPAGDTSADPRWDALNKLKDN